MTQAGKGPQRHQNHMSRNPQVIIHSFNRVFNVGGELEPRPEEYGKMNENIRHYHRRSV